jgi:hypothetical protein
MTSRQPNPLPSDGVVGKLTPQQESSLKVRSAFSSPRTQLVSVV